MRAAEGVGPYGNAEFGIWNEEEAENPRVSPKSFAGAVPAAGNNPPVTALGGDSPL